MSEKNKAQINRIFHFSYKLVIFVTGNLQVR